MSCWCCSWCETLDPARPVCYSGFEGDSAVQIVQAVNSPWVGINLDTGNFRDHGYSQIEACIPYAVNVQFKTEIAGDNGKPQKADWNRIMAMFAKAGYKGYLALEYEAKEDAAVAVPRHLRHLHELARKYSAA